MPATQNRWPLHCHHVLSLNSKPSNITLNTNNITPLSATGKPDNKYEESDKDTISHGTIIPDEITKIEYPKHKIAIQQLEIKIMKKKSNELEDASINLLVQFDDSSLIPEGTNRIPS